MNTHADKKQENKNQSVANTSAQKNNVNKLTFQFDDNRTETALQKKLQAITDTRPQSIKIAQLNHMDEIQNPQMEKEGEELVQKKENKTGLPDNLKSGIENLSGYSLDDVKVYYNSDKPAQLQAHAYAQGTDIHLASGQEKHLPHEAWHVVQQKQGRVKPTLQMKGVVNINNDDELEKGADLMGVEALALQFSEKQQAMDQTSSIYKSLTGQSGVFQMRWINIEGTNQSYWEGRRLPTPRDLAELASNGRVQVDYQYQSMLNAPNSTRPHGLFLAPSNANGGEVGAPFPLPQPSVDQEMPHSIHHEDVSWFHDGSRVQHSEPRRSERTIHGGVSARDRLQQYGLPDYERAAWAHTQPDHATPADQDREDIAMRHPSTEQANQQHTVREFAQLDVARRMGGVVASRHLQGEQPGRPGLYSTMDFGTTFLTGEDTRTHSDSVPYFTHEAGRYGDEETHARMLSTFGANALASSMRDEGFLNEEDLPDRFYIPSDGMEIDSENEASQSTSGLEDEESLSNSFQTHQTLPSGYGGGGGVPVIAPALPNTLNLAQMDNHYHAGNIWAGNQGTFSLEFGLFQANPVNTFNVLVQGGLLQADAHAFAITLINSIAIVANLYQQQNLALPGYLPANIQDWIFDQIDPVHGRSLWALLRYLNATNFQGNGY